MTYEYSLDNFLSYPLNGDQRLIINDKNNNYVDSITTDISHSFVKNNCLVIKITNKNDLILSFISNSVAKQALDKLDSYRKSLIYNSTFNDPSRHRTLNILNRNMMCNDLTPCVDYQLAHNQPVLQKTRSRIEVIVRGSSHVYCGYPDGVHVGCYFTSVDAAGDPTLARVNDGDVQVGDMLYWIGSIAGFDLDSTDYMDYDYLVDDFNT